MHAPLRKIVLALGALVVLGLLGCDSAERLDNFNVDVREQVTVPGASVLEQLLGGFPTLDDFNNFDLAQTSTFQNTKYSVDDVDSVNLESLTFTVISPDGQDLAFLGEVIFYVQAEGLERKEIARQDNFPAGATEVAFDTTPDDLKQYLLAREADITVETLDSKRPNQDTVVEVEAIFDVDVNVF